MFSIDKALNFNCLIHINIRPYAIFYAVSTRGIAFASSSYHKIVWTYIYGLVRDSSVERLQATLSMPLNDRGISDYIWTRTR